jgi:hypothetical protein
MKIENQQNYPINLQFSGGRNLSATVSGSYTMPFIAGGLYVGGTGTVVATTIDGSVLTFNVTGSTILPGLFQAVSASSTATGLVALK